MEYVAFLSFKSSASSAERDAALARRATWQYPDGIRLIAEYWPASSTTQVVSIFSTEGYGPIFELVLNWNDVFDIDVSPAVSADEGLRLGADALGRVARLQQG